MDLKELMNKSLDSFRLKLSKIRAGRANVDILDSVRVEYYGDMVPLNQVASLSVSDAKTIVIDPWDKSMLEGINKAIQKA
ncbi:MAG TPA: ribosome recycling factor, partial [Fusobacteria bacterium]|nr:ribosome recycling factor [Fusobacteriota bacterium]